jgi:hypothetical protein
MISDETRKKYAEESDSDITYRLVEAYDETEANHEIDTVQAILDESLTILKERIDEATDD